MKDKKRDTLSLNKKEDTQELEQERDELKTQLEDIEALKSSPNGFDVDDAIKPGELEIEVGDAGQTVEDESPEKESSLAAAARKGRERSDPRFIEAAKRDPDMLDMGADFDLKMTIHGDFDGYHTHWFKDAPGRIERKLSEGYMPIYKDEIIKIGDGADDFNDDMDTWVSTITGTWEGGRAQTCYAMKMPQELYELRKAKQRKERVTDVEDQIKSGDYLKEDGDQRYIDQSRTKFEF